MVICLERGANDLHMVQLMPLPPHHLCSIKIQNGLLFGAGLPRLSWKKGREMDVVVVVVVVTVCSLLIIIKIKYKLNNIKYYLFYLLLPM